MRELFKKMEYIENEINSTNDQNRIAMLKKELLNCKQLLTILMNEVYNG